MSANRKPASASTSKSALTSTRLYIGNLSPSVDEYSLMQLCSRHGKITKLDFLFHKTGPLKGKPRGYAFVEFESVQEAQQARNNLHDKLVRGRKINVMQASEQVSQQLHLISHCNALTDRVILLKQQTDERTYSSGSGGPNRSSGGGYHGRHSEPLRPTTISLLKGQGVAHASTDRKIAALEAKLAAIKRSKPTNDDGADSASGGQSTSRKVSSANESTRTEEFLSNLQVNIDAASMSTSSDGHSNKIVVDAQKAGLPAKPNFEVQMPP
ncbi:hypothetical protein OIV83_004995 [Microbotryomycetes sp. JL201]|nr:hypothetical protein OIV83_004995 [Microbotryomycetes sp. JL201]